MAKTLIAFFSRADENYFGGAMRYVKVGNTEIVVNGMKEQISADTFKIEMKAPLLPSLHDMHRGSKKGSQDKRKTGTYKLPGQH